MKLLEDDKAVSPVIGELLMIVVVVVIAALVVAFTYNLVWSATEESPVNIIIEDAKPGSSNITIVHMGGYKIGNAFAPSYVYKVNATIFKNMEVRINGAIYEGWASLNSGAISKADFAGGDELELGLDMQLSQGDSISVIYVPSGQILLRVVVV
jgi:flagellin-like protein